MNKDTKTITWDEVLGMAQRDANQPITSEGINRMDPGFRTARTEFVNNMSRNDSNIRIGSVDRAEEMSQGLSRSNVGVTVNIGLNRTASRTGTTSTRRSQVLAQPNVSNNKAATNDTSNTPTRLRQATTSSRRGMARRGMSASTEIEEGR